MREALGGEDQDLEGKYADAGVRHPNAVIRPSVVGLVDTVNNSLEGCRSTCFHCSYSACA